MTKLVARILAGPTVIETEAVVRWFRLYLPRDRARGRYILIAFAPELECMVAESLIKEAGYTGDYYWTFITGGCVGRTS